MNTQPSDTFDTQLSIIVDQETSASMAVTNVKSATGRVARELGRIYSQTEASPCEGLKKQGGTQCRALSPKVR
ncbi:unnamed protein product [Dibothriocephalus latus]|uniref:Uncharacterized protein n=1 Tax=Dibothriocephalus latus TaxID=60516 RepID=A0A3P7P4I5_DIBLA|nr:unnamed protein product [Dibothriocephalus latus]